MNIKHQHSGVVRGEDTLLWSSTFPRHSRSLSTYTDWSGKALRQAGAHANTVYCSHEGLESGRCILWPAHPFVFPLQRRLSVGGERGTSISRRERQRVRRRRQDKEYRQRASS